MPEEGKTFGMMLVLRTLTSSTGNLAINILNELERSQVLESDVLMARRQCRNKEPEVFSKIMKRIFKHHIMEGKQRFPGKSFLCCNQLNYLNWHRKQIFEEEFADAKLNKEDTVERNTVRISCMLFIAEDRKKAMWDLEMTS